MKRKLAIAGGVVLALLVAFLAGRYSGPARVVERVKVETRRVTVTEWKDRIVEKRVEGPVREVEVVVEKPGAERTITRWIERGPVTTDRATDATGKTAAQAIALTTASKTTETGRPGWSVALSADTGSLSITPDRYGLEIRRRLFGTLWLGARASTDRTGGLSLALEF